MTGGTHPKRKTMKYSEEQLQLFIFRITHQGMKLLLIMTVVGILIRKTRYLVVGIVDRIFVCPINGEVAGYWQQHQVL